MEADQQTNPAAVFPQMLTGAVSHLKDRLQRQYEHAYPGFGDIIRIVLDTEEARAWDLSPFPHLFLPDLVEAHIAELGLQPARLQYHDELPPAEVSPIQSDQFF